MAFLRGGAVALFLAYASVTFASSLDLPNDHTLTFTDRVAYQRAIEEVYWQNRIWPGSGRTNSDPKPPLDKVMPQTALEKKVEEYLHNSQVLEEYWQRPITSDQLQAEMDRIATHTQQPEVLREIFAALGNDPVVIAECLVRPILAERALSGVRRSSLRSSSFVICHSSFRYYTLPVISGSSHPCTNDTWVPTSLTNVPQLRNEHTAVWTGSEMIVWGGSGGTELFTGGKYVPSTDSWTATSTNNVPTPRYHHTAIWTGSEMIVWGGFNSSDPLAYLYTGGRYNPETNSWTATSNINVPHGRELHTAVWTGTEMIVWGGFYYDLVNQAWVWLQTGGRYNPNTDSWTATGHTDVPHARLGHTAVWTGSEMIVWGGESGNYHNTGSRYDPNTDSWTDTSTENAPSPRSDHTVVWTGSQMIVWGGFDGFTYVDTGGIYNPENDGWTATSTFLPPERRHSHTAIWTGNEMIVWGGSDFGSFLNTGGRYNPSNDSWGSTIFDNAPTARAAHSAVWTGSEMIIWGGAAPPNFYNTGARYCASIPGPTATPTPASVTISGTISYCSNPSLGPVPNVTLTLSGSTSGTTLSDSSGNYIFSVPSGGSYTVTPSKAPVAPASASINTIDVVAVQRHFLIIGTPLSGCRLLAADVNGDTAINTIDVTAIQRFVLALTTGTANVGQYQFAPPNRAYLNLNTNQTNQNYDALVFGDVAPPFVE